MANICLPEEIIEKFKDKFRTGEFSPEKLAEMTSEQRHSAFADLVGGETATSINALFESKLLLENQKAGIISWAQKIVGQRPEALRDLVSRVNRMDKVLNPKELDAFLQDLAAQKLGLNVTMEEAAKISQLAREATEAKEKIPADSPIGSAARMEYGVKLALFKEYIGGLKLESAKTPLVEAFKTDPIGFVKDKIVDLGGIAKSIKASWDNSFWLRQGIKTFYSNPDIWTKNFLKSWTDIGKELKGQDAMTPIKADVFSRPNAINGRYEKMKLDIGIGREEAFPSALPEKIPLLRRLYKASESAFNGAALRMRADLADRYLKLAEKQGIKLTDTTQMESIGNLVNAMTGRGKSKLATQFGKELNAGLFSYRFFKSNLDFITAHALQKDVTPFVRKQAATNLLRMVGGVAAIQALSEFLNPGSVDNKKHLGKIKILDAWVDLTGGVASVAQLAYNIIEKMGSQSGKYGEDTALDIFERFWEGKLSPLAAVVRDHLKGETFEGDKPTLESDFRSLFEPLPVSSAIKIRESGNTLGFLILDALGAGVSVPFQTNWNNNPTQELQSFREQVGQEKFDAANKEFNQQYQAWIREIDNNRDYPYHQLSDEEKADRRSEKKAEIKKGILEKYGYKKPKK